MNRPFYENRANFDHHSAPTLPERALHFAQVRFMEEDVRRKYTDKPYITHCIEVANIVKKHNGTENMVAAAFLHDTVEDTKTTIGEIYKEFGAEIGFMVQCLTDVTVPEDGNRAVRKGIEAQRLSQAPSEVHTIKLADMLSNGKDISKHDARFAKVYMREMLSLLVLLTKGDTGLFRKCRDMIEEYEG